CVDILYARLHLYIYIYVVFVGEITSHILREITIRPGGQHDVLGRFFAVLGCDGERISALDTGDFDVLTTIGIEVIDLLASGREKRITVDRPDSGIVEQVRFVHPRIVGIEQHCIEIVFRSEHCSAQTGGTTADNSYVCHTVSYLCVSSINLPAWQLYITLLTGQRQ